MKSPIPKPAQHASKNEIKECPVCEKNLHLWESDVVALSRLPERSKAASVEAIKFFHAECFLSIAGEEYFPGRPTWNPDWVKEKKE